MKFYSSDNVYEVTDLAHLHVHGKILRVDRIQRVARVVRGRSIDRSHEHFFFFLLSHVNRSGLVRDLHHKALLTFTVNLLKHDLDELEAAAVRYFFVFDWDGEIVFESGQMKLFRLQERQTTQGPVLVLFAFRNTRLVFFIDKILLH